MPACQAGVLGPGYLTHCLEQACRLQVGPTDPLHCGEGHSLQDRAGAQAGPQGLAEVSVAGSTRRGSPEEEGGGFSVTELVWPNLSLLEAKRRGSSPAVTNRSHMVQSVGRCVLGAF